MVELQQMEAERARARAKEEALWIEEQNSIVQTRLEKRLAEERAKAKAGIAEVKRKVKEEVQQMEADRGRARAEEEARWIEEQNSLVRERLEKRVSKEKMKMESEIAEVKRKLKMDQERAEAERAKARAEREARWLEEQNLLVQQRLEKRLTEEKAKANAEISQFKKKLREDQERVDADKARARAEEEAKRLAEENAKVNAEISQIKQEMEEKVRMEEAFVEERLQLRLAELEEEQDNQATGTTATSSSVDNDAISASDFLPQRSTESTHNDDANDDKSSEDLHLLPDEPPTTPDPTLMSNGTDVLAADVEALELISMCQAEFDPESPTYNKISASQKENGNVCLLPTEYPFVSLLRDSSPYIVNHRHSTIVYHIPGDLISNASRFNSVLDDIALTWLFGMKIVICVGCRKQIFQRLERLHGRAGVIDSSSKLGVRVTNPDTLRIVEEEAGFCRFEVERLLNRCLRNKGADCNVVSGCFITAKNFGVVDGVDYQHTGYPTTLQTDRIHRFHSRNDVVLLTPLGFTKDGDALNVHSEALAAFTAGALDASKLVYFSSNPMILRGSTDDHSNQRIQMIQRSNALQILSHYGLNVHTKTGFPHWRKNMNLDANLNHDQQAMLLKMGWATHALDRGVERAHIIDCEDGALLEELFTARRGYGTCISQDDYEAPHPEDFNDDLSVEDGVVAGNI